MSVKDKVLHPKQLSRLLEAASRVIGEWDEMPWAPEPRMSAAMADLRREYDVCRAMKVKP